MRFAVLCSSSLRAHLRGLAAALIIEVRSLQGWVESLEIVNQALPAENQTNDELPG
ncbi:hypothetical protein [Mesorhizobium sp.]|uniref:hypothetical protein n=1 Tax=Mesorhizobium sp. TaxID=1871066 RepID=UPI0025DCF635|nr:hypothetical protein [Mesorhizobium sp.]